LAKDIFLHRDITVRHLRTATNVMPRRVDEFAWITANAWLAWMVCSAIDLTIERGHLLHLR
jgi:hypothetical protein